MKPHRFKIEWVSAAEKTPPLGHSVNYRTPTHHGLGYVDATGRWLSFEGRVESDPVLDWSEPAPEASVYV